MTTMQKWADQTTIAWHCLFESEVVGMRINLMLLLVLAFSSPCFVSAGAASDESTAIERINDLGGLVERDDASPNRPVLRISFQHVDDGYLRHLKRPVVTDEGLKGIGRFKNLTDLNLAGTQITDAGIKELNGLNNLKTLVLSDTRLTDAALKELSGLENLTVLDIRRTRVSRTGLTSLKSLKNLITLQFTPVNIYDSDLKKMEGHNFKQADYSAAQISDLGLKAFRDQPRLTSLNLSFNRITNDGLVELKEIKTLTTLDLSWTEISDAGTGELIHHQQLRSLDLSHTSITDSGLVELASLTQLRTLSLLGTRVTDTGVERLQKSLPNTQISR